MPKNRQKEEEYEYCSFGTGDTTEYRKYWQNMLCNRDEITFNRTYGISN